MAMRCCCDFSLQHQALPRWETWHKRVSMQYISSDWKNDICTLFVMLFNMQLRENLQSESAFLSVRRKCFEEKKSWPLPYGVYSYCLLLHGRFTRRGALIMTLRDVSSEARMCPQNVAYIAQLTNFKSAALRPFKSRTGGGRSRFSSKTASFFFL